MCKNNFWHFPIVIILLASYLFYGYIWFGTNYLDIFNNLNEEAQIIISIFSFGSIGATVLASVNFAHDYNDSIFENLEDEIPYCLDFLGYIVFIFRGGFVSLVFYYIFKAGLFMILIDTKVEINKFASLIIAFSGGFASQQILKFVKNFVQDTVDPKNKNSRKKIINKNRKIENDKD